MISLEQYRCIIRLHYGIETDNFVVQAVISAAEINAGLKILAAASKLLRCQDDIGNLVLSLQLYALWDYMCMIYRMLSFNWYQQGRLTLYSDGASAPPTKLGGRKFRTSGGMYDNSMKHSLLVAFIVMKISQISSQIVFLNAINLIFWLLGAFPQTPTGWTLPGNFRPPGLRHQFFWDRRAPGYQPYCHQPLLQNFELINTVILITHSSLRGIVYQIAAATLRGTEVIVLFRGGQISPLPISIRYRLCRYQYTI